MTTKSRLNKKKNRVAIFSSENLDGINAKRSYWNETTVKNCAVAPMEV